MTNLSVRSTLLAGLLLLCGGCSDESSEKKPAAAPATPTWVTVENPPPGNGPHDKVRHIDFSLQHPSTWKVNQSFRERDERAFLRIDRRGEALPYDLVFQVRSFQRADPKRAAASFIDDMAETLTKVNAAAAAKGAAKRLLRKGPTTLAGKPAQEIVVLETDPGVPGKALRIWRRVVLLELSPTEWGTLIVHAWIGALNEQEDPEAADVQAEMQRVFDSLTLKP